jgi:GrpB-like predicted nucleotidyltransferase (UPF0157 family)
MHQVLPYGDRGPFLFLPYDDRAPLVFDLVARLITRTDPHLALEHVGSTAVPGCPGKGFIDVLVMVPTADDLGGASRAVQRVGFSAHDFGQGYPGARGAVKVDDSLFRIHIQIVPRHSQKAHEMTAFRELLRHDPELVTRYARQKRALIQGGHVRNPAYAEGKSDVILAALRSEHTTCESRMTTFRCIRNTGA